MVNVFGRYRKLHLTKEVFFVESFGGQRKVFPFFIWRSEKFFFIFEVTKQRTKKVDQTNWFFFFSCLGKM